MRAKTIAVVCNPNTPIGNACDVCIFLDTGPEVITGSTRMNAGTAQKMVLNILSTCAMVKQGYVYENLMINLKPANRKLSERMIGIVCEITGASRQTAEKMLQESGWNIRKCISGETE